MPDDYPQDPVGNSLRDLAEEGYDLTVALAIDYIVVVPTEQAAFLAATLASQMGYAYRIAFDETYGDWVCYCTRYMVLEYEAIVACMGELDAACAALGGHADGWSIGGL